MNDTILVTTSTFGEYDDAPLRMLHDAGYRPILNPHGRTLAEKEIGDMVIEQQPVGVIAGTEPFTRAVMTGGAPRLRVVSRVGAGLSNVDTQAASELGIAVCNTPDAPTQAVVELTVGLALAVTRRIAEADAMIRAGEWKKLMGSLIGGKTVGIIGVGRIGRAVGKAFAGGFGCRVIGYDPYLAEDSWNDAGMERSPELGQLLAQSDIITLHLSGSAMILGEKQFDSMKRGVIILNVARGGLLDEQALAVSLSDGRVAGAGLDVFSREPYKGPLTSFPQAVLTAHMGSYARETRARMELAAVGNLLTSLREGN